MYYVDSNADTIIRCHFQQKGKDKQKESLGDHIILLLGILLPKKK